jgi:hypothetical protein
VVDELTFTRQTTQKQSALLTMTCHRHLRHQGSALAARLTSVNPSNTNNAMNLHHGRAASTLIHSPKVPLSIKGQHDSNRCQREQIQAAIAIFDIKKGFWPSAVHWQLMKR